MSKSTNTALESEAPFSPIIALGIFEGLKSMGDSSDFSDVTVVAGDSEFKCHRMLLAGCSEFFKALLSSGMKEDLERKVELKEISRETFSDILNCLYQGKNILNEQNMFEIWHAANQLQIHFLLKETVVFIKQNISPGNCLAIYQHSKLLDASEITQFSWSFILKHFENIRRNEEVFMFNAVEMEKLIASQDLETHSEDGVLETILCWIAYVPSAADKLPESRNLEADQCLNCCDHCCLESQDKQWQESKEDPQDSNASSLIQVGVNEKKHGRANHLYDLMKAARTCLLSGKCLLDAFKNDFIRADRKAQGIIEEALQYQLCVDKRHDYCPPSAVHRLSSSFENVIVAIRNYLSSESLVCRLQDGKWYGFKVPTRGTFIYSAISFNNNIYVNIDSSLFVFLTMTNEWKELPKLTLQASISKILAVGNFLYAVYENKDHSIEMINIIENNGTGYNGRWIKAGQLSVEALNITCTTVVGDKIIFFGSVPEKPENIKVLVYDTTSFLCSELNDVLFQSTVEVSFSKGQDSFVLQKNGILYRIQGSSTPPFIEIKEEVMLWDFDRVLKGAVIFNDELLLFGPSFLEFDLNENKNKLWELSVQGVFKCVKNICCTEAWVFFTHTVMPKMHFSNAIPVRVL